VPSASAVLDRVLARKLCPALVHPPRPQRAELSRPLLRMSRSRAPKLMSPRAPRVISSVPGFEDSARAGHVFVGRWLILLAHRSANSTYQQPTSVPSPGQWNLITQYAQGVSSARTISFWYRSQGLVNRSTKLTLPSAAVLFHSVGPLTNLNLPPSSLPGARRRQWSSCIRTACLSPSSSQDSPPSAHLEIRLDGTQRGIGKPLGTRSLFSLRTLLWPSDRPSRSSRTMPEEITGKPTTEWRCTGHVVRLEPVRNSPGQVRCWRTV